MNPSKITFPIVKPYLPEIKHYQEYISDVFERNWLTNNGPLVQALESKLANYLGVDHLLLVANGTLALQVAYAALGIKGTVLTTPFSFAATASSLCWEGMVPKFVDIDIASLNIDQDSFEQSATKDVSAILGVHVFGNPCNVEAIDSIAAKRNLKVVYDAAHAFATQYKGSSVLSYGDASTLSLHATKLFHSVEGGAVVFKNKKDLDKAKQIIHFGFDNNSYPEWVGINAKMSEFHAAMGLAVFDDLDRITKKRALLAHTYREKLADCVKLQTWDINSDNTGAYQPILLQSEEQLLYVSQYLLNRGIQTRRYFYPSLSSVPAYGMQGDTPIANSISQCVLCLPMYTDLAVDDVTYITDNVKSALTSYVSSSI